MATTVVVFAGEYDFACRDQLRNFLEAYAEPNLVLDLSKVTYVDSSFVSELLRLHNRRRQKNFEPAIVVLTNPAVQRLFDILDLGGLFQIAGTLEEALRNNGKAVTIEFAFRGGDVIESGPFEYEAADGTLSDARLADASD